MTDVLQSYNDLVALRYRVYNGIFLTLGLDGIHQTGIMLPLFTEACHKGLQQGSNPEEIINDFFSSHGHHKDERLAMLFRFVQYIERQIVLIDGLEDASYNQIHNVGGAGSYRRLVEGQKTIDQDLKSLKDLFENFRIRIILTAHPTQFYPGEVLSIINDLITSINQNNLSQIKILLEQLGRTPFFKKTKPTPFDEAVSLIWYLENVLYHSIPSLYEEIYASLGDEAESIIGDSAIIKLGFWPGGDRDGNPFVNADTTLRVADRLQKSLYRCYYRDIRLLRRRLTFRDIVPKITQLEEDLKKIAFTDSPPNNSTTQELKSQLRAIENILIKKYNSLFLKEVKAFRHKITIFKSHFASLDIRQDSRIIGSAMEQVFNAYPSLVPEGFHDMDDKEQISALFSLKGEIDYARFNDPIVKDTLEVFTTIKHIQQRNGNEGSYRYIISNCRSVLNMAQVFALATLSGWKEHKYLDIIPLFETIDDLELAGTIMSELYDNKDYRKHLHFRHEKQVIMLGFSDGTKDGSYLTANWSIFKAKEMITGISRENGIRAVFFDGRGGPPARGGGETHKFYASLGPEIESTQIQLTIQGQTISANFGTLQSSRYNLEQLLTAGITNHLTSEGQSQLSESQRKILDQLSADSYDAYKMFKSDPQFLLYLQDVSPLIYYAKANIGSRPSRRGGNKELRMEDLRAIPFVGAWSQLKQNIPAFYGLGTALQKLEERGSLNDAQQLYSQSLFFRTLIENSMQSLCKTHFDLTQYLAKDKEYGKFWSRMYEEYQTTKKYILEISGQKELLDSQPSNRQSIQLREDTILPLLVIQQYALIMLRKMKSKEISGTGKEDYEKLVIRTLYGNINASRNSV